MLDLSPERIKEICGAALLAGGPSRVSEYDAPRRAVADSRCVEQGDLFVGIRGEHADGGDFAEAAVDAGAWGVIVRPEYALNVAGKAGSRVRVFGVEDPLEALGRLGRAWVDKLWAEGCRVVAITGSTGKTSTKDILRALLENGIDEPVHASPANYNTEIGVPLAALEASAGTSVLVLEMAMRGPGQISELCAIAPPAVGVITNVGPVHLELLGTVEAVAEAKAELIAALPLGGACVVPAFEEALHPHLRREIRTFTFAMPAGSGDGLENAERIAGAAADVRLLATERAIVRGAEGLRAEVAIGSERTTLELNFRQAHNVANALAAIGAAHALGVPTGALAEGAASVRFSELRGEEVEVGEGALLINDCYNANPVSMRAALDHLAEVASQRNAPRVVAVLGEMAELGDGTAAFHREIGTHAAQRGVGVVVAVGGDAAGYVEGYGGAGEVRTAADAEEAAQVTLDVLAPGDVVLVKGSRSVGLESVSDALAGRARDDGGTN
jgi:UDP-N-acetylmuramoyl-tripeptide--D-alanyl-D-alanine ligase